MNNLTLHTPEGVRDIYNSEYESKLELLHQVFSTIKTYGYSPISTPTFEFFDTFSKEVGSCASNEMYKFFDREGNTLVLRPDITPSIARAAAMYFAESGTPCRLSYEGNVFINYHSLQGRLKESTQTGAELIGDGTIEADAEILAMAINSLKAAGLSEFQITVGHIDIVKGLIKACNFDEEKENLLKQYISNKNFFGAIEYLGQNNISKNLIDLFGCIGKIYSEPEDWAEFIELSKDYPVIMDALKYLADLYELLKLYEVDQYISFELGTISSYKYYTGIVFAGYTYKSGAPIVKGGRYDSLLSIFGKDAPAIGFAVYADQLLFALERQKAVTLATDKPIVACYKKNGYKEALAYATECRKNGAAVLLLAEGTQFEIDQDVKYFGE